MKVFIRLVFSILLIVGGSSAYAGCTVNGTTENGAISLTDLKTAIATGTDDVTTCNVSSITNMSWMFYENTSFNQDISDWNVSSVTTMYAMFRGTTAFNNGGVALDWSDTSSVTTMRNMFKDATAFNNGGVASPRTFKV